jgi:hypothetical protein
MECYDLENQNLYSSNNITLIKTKYSHLHKVIRELYALIKAQATIYIKSTSY